MFTRKRKKDVLKRSSHRLVPFLFFLIACLGREGLSASAASENTLVLAIPSDPKSFNALVAQETSTTEVTGYLFEGLTEMDPGTGEVRGRLASGWEASPDGLVWTFHIRPEAVWSDGVPLTAADVVFTFRDLIYNPAVLTGAKDIFTMEGRPVQVEAVDERTVRFTLPAPFAPFLLALSQPIFPEHILRRAVETNRFSSTWGTDEAPEKIVGSGPFRLKRYLAGERVELVRNERYWKKDGAGNRLPYLERIVYLVLPSPDVRMLKFLEGEIDLYAVGGADYPVLKPREKEKKFVLAELGASLGSDFLVFNQKAKDPARAAWFARRAFRQAVAYALDRDAMIDIVYNRLGVKQCSPESPSIPFFFNPGTPCYDHDLNKAKAVLAGAGFRDTNGDGFVEDTSGKTVEFLIATNADNPVRMQIAGIIREDLTRLGLKVHLLSVEFNSLVRKLTVSGDWDAAVLGLTGTPDPHFGANVWLSGGSLHFWNPRQEKPATDWEKRIDEIFNQGVKTLERAGRKKLYDEWQEIAARELPLIYTVTAKVVLAYRDRFENVRPTVLGGVFHNIEEIRPRRSAA